MTTLDTEQWIRPTTLDGFQKLLNDILSTFAGHGYDLGTYGPVECLKSVLESKALLTEIADVGAEEMVSRARAAQVKAERDAEQFRKRANELVVENEALRWQTPERWAAEDL